MDINSILKNHNIDAINDNEKVIDRLVAKNIKEYKSEINNNITNIINKNIIENQNKPNGTIQLDKEGKIPSELLPNNLSNQQFEELNKKLNNLKISGGTDWSKYKTIELLEKEIIKGEYGKELELIKIDGEGYINSLAISTPSSSKNGLIKIFIDDEPMFNIKFREDHNWIIITNYKNINTNKARELISLKEDVSFNKMNEAVFHKILSQPIFYKKLKVNIYSEQNQYGGQPSYGYYLFGGVKA